MPTAADAAVHNRRMQFRAALDVAAMTQYEWAERIAHVTPSYLSRVLRGHADSARLEAKIDAFIAKWGVRVATNGAGRDQ